MDPKSMMVPTSVRVVPIGWVLVLVKERPDLILLIRILLLILLPPTPASRAVGQ